MIIAITRNKLKLILMLMSTLHAEELITMLLLIYTSSFVWFQKIVDSCCLVKCELGSWRPIKCNFESSELKDCILRRC